MSPKRTPKRTPIRFKLAVAMAAHPDGPKSQLDVARDTGIPVATIARIYHNKTRRITLPHLELLCDYFDVSPGDLMVRGE